MIILNTEINIKVLVVKNEEKRKSFLMFKDSKVSFYIPFLKKLPKATL